MGFKKQVYQIDLRSHLPFVRVNGFQRQVCCIGLGSYLFDLSFEGRQKVSVLKSPGFWSPCLCAEPVSESRGILNIPEFSFFFGAESGRQGFFPSETVFPCARAGCAACRFHLVMARCRRWTFRKGIRKFRRHVFVEHFWFAISAFVR